MDDESTGGAGKRRGGAGGKRGGAGKRGRGGPGAIPGHQETRGGKAAGRAKGRRAGGRAEAPLDEIEAATAETGANRRDGGAGGEPDTGAGGRRKGGQAEAEATAEVRRMQRKARKATAGSEGKRKNKRPAAKGKAQRNRSPLDRFGRWLRGLFGGG